MRVTALEPLVVAGGHTNWVFVHVHTDEGLTGVGEATLEGQSDSVVAALGELEQVAVGKDARRIQHLWQEIYRHSFFRGGPIRMSALSGLEQALWDIKGKAAGQPVYELLGGACRDRVKLYANGPRGESLEELAASAERISSDGFRALKFSPIDATAPVAGSSTIRDAAARVEAVREAVGADVEIAIDVHGRLSPAMSIQLARAIEKYDIWFLEEPALPENAKALAQIARATHIPIATGERLFTKWGFREILELGACALVQPDLAHCGGIFEARLIAAMAETHYTGFAPHNPLSAVNTAASAHVAMATPNFVALEWVFDHPWRDGLLTEPLEISDGYLSAPRRPGLGIQLDLDACRELPAQSASSLPGFWHEDGAVADW